jgi:hypothetical protein
VRLTGSMAESRLVGRLDSIESPSDVFHSGSPSSPSGPPAASSEYLPPFPLAVAAGAPLSARLSRPRAGMCLAITRHLSCSPTAYRMASIARSGRVCGLPDGASRRQTGPSRSRRSTRIRRIRPPDGTEQVPAQHANSKDSPDCPRFTTRAYFGRFVVNLVGSRCLGSPKFWCCC